MLHTHKQNFSREEIVLSDVRSSLCPNICSLRPNNNPSVWEKQRRRGVAMQLLTQLLRLKGQRPTCWRRESQGPRTPNLTSISSSLAAAWFRGYMTPTIPPLPPYSPPSTSRFSFSLYTREKIFCFSWALLHLLCLFPSLCATFSWRTCGFSVPSCLCTWPC